MAWPSEYNFTTFAASGGILSGGIGSGQVGTSHLTSGIRIFMLSGSAANPALQFPGTPCGIFTDSDNRLSFSIGGVWSHLFSWFGVSLIISPNRSMTILPQRQTNGIGDDLTLEGGPGLGGDNSGGKLILFGGPGVGIGGHGLITFRDAPNTVDRILIDTSGFAEFKAGFVGTYTAGEAISGIKAVTLASGDGSVVVRAERQSGLRMPSIGVSITNAVSGASIEVVDRGFVTFGISGQIASGFHGTALYVGSGGHIVNKSGFMGGASSGPGWGMFSGSFIQSVGRAISGGLFVDLTGEVRLATISGLGAQTASGQFPISGFPRGE